MDEDFDNPAFATFVAVVEGVWSARRSAAR